MKFLLNSLSIIALTSITVPNTILNNSNPHQDMHLKNNKIAPDKGVNEIILWYDGSYTIKVNFDTLDNWYSIVDSSSRQAKILDDIRNFKSWSKNQSEYPRIAAAISGDIKNIIHYPHIFIYGVAIDYDGQNIKVKQQYSPDSSNASMTQENYVWFGHNHLNIYISRYQWYYISQLNKSYDDIKLQLGFFPQDPAWNKNEISDEYLGIMTQVIIDHFDEINKKFTSSTQAWIVETNTVKYLFGIVAQ